MAVVGRQMDDVLAHLRDLARGIYPSLLHDRGLADALRAAVRSSPTPGTFRRGHVGRHSEDIEASVYYSCVEAIQNVTKHAGPGATVWVALWQDTRRLWFEVRDTGVGFDSAQAPAGAGLINMRDRIDTVGGAVEVVSRPGHGTVVRGSVPIVQGG